MAFLPETRSGLLWLGLFAVAMAQLEAAVVVYLRELYYPAGFSFPLVLLPRRIGAIELGREAATLVMLVGVARLSTRDPWRRLSRFLLVFGMWDVLYYVWLRVFLGWPESLLTPDILFLIPGPWVGPVLAPVSISLVMILAGLGLEDLRDRQRRIPMGKAAWALVTLSALGMLGCFLRDASLILHGELPRPFAWGPFGAFLLLGAGVAFRVWRRAG